MRILRSLRHALAGHTLASHTLVGHGLAAARAFVFLCAIVATARSASAQGCANSTNDCFTANLLAPGCSNASCCTLVCAIEPSCCEVAWDEICVQLATKFCSDCGSVKESCFVAHPTPSCSTGTICEAVCAIDPQCCDTAWDKDCVNLAISLTDECGEPATGSCLGVHENPNCADQACCEQVCSIDPNCCTVTWDQTCVDWAAQYCFTCGNPRAGSCCYQHEGPYCDDRQCCEAVCAFDPFCCSTRWDTVCADLATAPGSLCNLPKCRCGDNGPIPGQNLSCKAVHITPGCNDFICCDKVCSVDPFCCNVSWDYTCTQLAVSNCALSLNPDINLTCSEATGSCFVKHDGPGCSDAACCAAVCTFDPTCCDVTWDADCALRAVAACNGCGDVEAGSCFFPHGTPSCLDAECCNDVCAIDPTCCAVEWDLFCVLNAGTICLDSTVSCGDPRTRPCSVPSFVPNCEDEECCALICAVDPTCCSRAWDETCAVGASISCDISFPNCPSSGSPLEVHGPGCSDQACCEAVCAVDPICCSFGWNENCVDKAKAVCVGFATCPGQGECGSAHANPGCRDATCCTIVCAADPLCCEETWSSACASAARTLCSPLDTWRCPCEGSCFEARSETAGCEDEVCCSGVCNIDPTCCTVVWDAGCAAIARQTCCGFPDCGNNCAGDCFTSKTTPYCNDASCCEAVCRFEPYCCDVRWDSSCVAAARVTCEGGCGLPVSGNCFNSHDTRGCSNAACCEAVCALEEFEGCCSIAWTEACAEQARKLCQDDVPQCGDFGIPGCNIAHPSPSCSDEDCCDAVCDIDPFCCEAEWDQTCVEKIYTTAGCERYQAGCGGLCSGDCCTPRDTPWCNDLACCEAVCLVDIFCCDVRWDEFCAATANITPACGTACPDPLCGTPEAGNCCLPHNNANCSDLDCCNTVCAIDQTCCEVVWDAICAAIANAECDTLCGGGLSCGDLEAGSCCNEHDTPFCNNAKCCALVCSFDETCCITEWDTTCVKLAQAFCGCGSLDDGSKEGSKESPKDGGSINEDILEQSVKSGIVPEARLERLDTLKKPGAPVKK